MPLSIPDIESQIDDLIEKTEGLDREASRAMFKKELAKVIINAIKSATITIPTGSVITVGSPSTQTNNAPVIVQDGLS